MHNSVDKNRGAHGVSSFKLDGLPSSRENPLSLGMGSVNAGAEKRRYMECIEIIKQLPSAERKIGTSNNQVHLCNSCKYNYPECPYDANVIFGDGRGNDNICACSKYVAGSKKGEWKHSGWKEVYACSVCGNFLDFSGVNAGRGDTNYCPNCGADMR